MPALEAALALLGQNVGASAPPLGAPGNATLRSLQQEDEAVLHRLVVGGVLVFVLRLLDYVIPALVHKRGATFLRSSSEDPARLRSSILEGDALRSSASALDPAPEPESESAAQSQIPLGQVVWVRDSCSNAVPWIRGVVEGHEPGSGKPLVRAVNGRLKTWKYDAYRTLQLTYWTAEESLAPRAWVHVLTAPPGFTSQQLCFCGSSWVVACESKDLSPQSWNARVQGASRLLFWHVLQPFVYFWAYDEASQTLGERQQLLGGGVYMREVMYLVSVLLCTVVNPAFLIVDVATVNGAARTESVYNSDGLCTETRVKKPEGDTVNFPAFLCAYVFLPHFYVLNALRRGNPAGLENCAMLLATYTYIVLDFFGIFALGSAFDGDGNLVIPLALAIGYGATVIAPLLFFLALIAAGLVACRSGKHKEAVLVVAFGISGIVFVALALKYPGQALLDYVVASLLFGVVLIGVQACECVVACSKARCCR